LLGLLIIGRSGTSSAGTDDYFISVLNPGAQTKSGEYRVEGNGVPIPVYRGDGRVGPTSYARVLLHKQTRFTIRCESGTGSWRINSLEPLKDVEKTDSSISFSLSRPSKLFVHAGVSERFFLFVDVPDPEEPSLSAANVVSLEEYGVKSSGDAVLTTSLQRAIDDVSTRSDVDTLYVPPGLYRTGTLHMRDNTTVYLAAGAVLRASEDPKDLPFDPGTFEFFNRTQSIRSRLILFDGVRNSALRGRGELDGMGQRLRAKFGRVPNLIRIRRSRDVLVEGLVLRRAAGWNTHVFHSSGVTLRNLMLISNWSDGLDIDNSRNVSVEDVLSSAQDDSFTVKATRFDGTAERVAHIHVRKAILWTEKAAAKIGTETNAEVMEDISFEDIQVANAREAFAIKLYDRAVVRNVRIRGASINANEHALLWELRDRYGKGRIEDVEVEDLHMERATPSMLTGLDRDHGIEGVRFADIRIAERAVLDPKSGGFQINEFVDDLKFESDGQSVHLTGGKFPRSTGRKENDVQEPSLQLGDLPVDVRSVFELTFPGRVPTNIEKSEDGGHRVYTIATAIDDEREVRLTISGDRILMRSEIVSFFSLSSAIIEHVMEEIDGWTLPKLTAWRQTDANGLISYVVEVEDNDSSRQKRLRFP